MEICKFVGPVLLCVIIMKVKWCTAVTVVKCCPYGKRLDSNLANCVPLHKKTLIQNTTISNSSQDAHMYYGTTDEDIFWLPGALMDKDVEVKVHNGKFKQNRALKLKESCDWGRLNILPNGTLKLFSPTAFNNSISSVYESEEFCVDFFSHENGTKENAILVFPCSKVTCVSKCCKKDYVFACRGPICGCKKSDESNWSVLHPDLLPPAHDFAYEVIYSALPECSTNLIPLAANLWAYPEHITRKYWDYPNGKIFKTIACSEMIWRKGQLRLGVVRCVTRRPFPGVIDFSYGLHVPEIVMLLLAILTILLVPRRRMSAYSYVHDYGMVCHAGSLFVRGLLWAISIKSVRTICRYTAIILYFTSVAASLWLNVICMNLAFGFWRPLGHLNSHWGGARAIFTYYSLYAWGVSSAMTALTAGMWYAKDVPSYLIRPTLYETRTCHNEDEGEGKLATFAYFYGPILGLLAINALLFLSTAFRVSLLRRNTSILKRKRERTKETSLHNKRSVIVYVKLLWLMGMLEIAMETVAWASDINKYYFAVATSALDVLRAATIFSLCRCKKSTLRALRDRLRCCDRCAGAAPTKPDETSKRHSTSQTTDVSVVTSTSEDNAANADLRENYNMNKF